MGGCDHFLSGSVLFLAGCGWVLVGVTLFWLGVVDVGGCGLFFAGCGWV